jgi:hypothetical protein
MPNVSLEDPAGASNLLVMSSPRRRQPHTWCSPRRILDEWLQWRGGRYPVLTDVLEVA